MYINESRLLHTKLQEAQSIRDANLIKKQFWYTLELVLYHQGRISLYLNPARKDRDPDIVASLKSELHIRDDSVILDRSMRNHIAHYDERIEDWHKDPSNLVMRCIGPVGVFTPDQPTGKHIFWQYDPKEPTLYFWDDSINLSKLLEELESMKKRLLPHRSIF